MRRQSGKTESNTSALALVLTQRTAEDLRAAQVAVASSVVGDDRLTSDLSREFELMDLLQILGLYRRI